jgi:hypothetical protein
MTTDQSKGGVELDAGLLEAVAGGRAVLFLGAGASLGATRVDGTPIPAARELGRRIAAEFLGAGYEDADFKTICDFAASARSGREVQAFIHKQLIGFAPASFHLLIPSFAWAGIATTNYDQVIEEAYKSVEARVQDLVPNCRDGDGTAERLGVRGLLYVKLHGCISHYQEVDPPLVASTEQIINHREGRAGQFAQFLEWAKTKSTIDKLALIRRLGPQSAEDESSGAKTLPSKDVATFVLTIPARLRRAGMGMRMVVDDGSEPARVDAGLVRVVVRAFAIRDRLLNDHSLTLNDIAALNGIVPSYATRLFRLTFLAPDIIATILDGRQPPELTVRRLLDDTRLPLDWTEQRTRLGLGFR